MIQRTALVLAALVLANAALAQTYPQRPIRFVVPFTTGGGADLAARLVGQKLGEALGQPVVIENRLGVNGNIGAEAVARGPADGHTLTVGSSANITTNPYLYKLNWNPLKDLVPVAMLSTNPMVLFVNPALIPVNNVAELLAHAKAKNGTLDYATGGGGSPAHMATELLAMLAGVKMVPIHYKGGTPATNDVLGGQVGFMFAAAPTVMPHVRAGRVRAIATSAAKRAASLPDLPTVAEAGFPEFDVPIWNMLLAPAQTPAAIVQRLNAEINRITGTTEIKEALAKQGAEPFHASPAELARFVAVDYERWGKVVKAANIKAE